jgi:tetratricopeptide (TPR) repeat protein
METENIKEQIDNMRTLDEWSKILFLIKKNNLKGIWFQTVEAEALLQISQKDEAKKLIEKVICSANTQDPKEMFLLGKCYYLLGDIPNSILWHEKAARLEEPSSQNNLGAHYVR